MRNALLAAFCVVLLGGGCVGASPSAESQLGFSYVLPADGSVTVSKTTVAARSLFTADDLFLQATECGFARTADYYLDLENLFTGLNAEQYTFAGAGSQSASWTVTVMANAPVYSSLESFKTDFDICAAGGKLYPSAVSANTLLFVESCGSGMEDAASTGCEAIRSAIEGTITIE